MKKWKMPKFDPEQLDRLSREGRFPQRVAEVLAGRGEDLQEDAPLCNPFLMKDMDKAVQRLIVAVEEGEMIAVYGDYDCDGITATAMLYSYLQDLGARVMYYIPDRDTEGYGLNTKAVEELWRHGVRLIVTVDNGISAIEEVAYAKGLGLEVLITDHHHPREALPDAVAILNPHRQDCSYPFPDLCGVGVAFKLICAMEGDESCEEMLLHYGNLVAIGTVGDIVALRGENRTIVKNGLESIANCENLGLNALIELSGLSGKKINSTHLAFGIVPRINAAGRIGQASKAVELLLTEDEEDAALLAEELNHYNLHRKELVLAIDHQIEERIRENPALAQERLLILSGEGWHPGVIGIAASRLVERYSKPCLLLCTQGEEARGSARSVEGYSIIDAIARCHSRLSHYGGHEQAAGVSLRAEEVPAFREELLQDARQQFDIMPVDTLQIDLVLKAAALTLETVEELAQLEPFGCGNETPLIALLCCKLEEVTAMSGDKHLRLRFSQEGIFFQAIYFGMSSKNFSYRVGDFVDLATNLEENEYHGSKRVSVRIKEIHPSALRQDKMVVGRQYYEKYKRQEALEQNIIDYIRPSREDIAKLYRFLKREGGFGFGYDLLWSKLGGLNYCKMMLCLDVMQELGLLVLEEEERIVLPESTKKVDLSTSLILKSLKAGEEKW